MALTEAGRAAASDECRACDRIFNRIKQAEFDFWADPAHRRTGEINTNDGGRGLYFDDLDGHNLQIITRPYGGG